MSRFLVVEVSVLSPQKEAGLLKEKTGIEDSDIDALIALSKSLRKEHSDGQIGYFCSTRDLIMASNLVSRKIPLNHAISFSILNKISSDDLEYLKDKHTSIKAFIDYTIESNGSITEQLQRLENAENEKNRLTKEIEAIKASKKDYEKEIDDVRAEYRKLGQELTDRKRELAELQEAKAETRKQILKQGLKELIDNE